jgi:hypothetical protein
MSTSPNWSYQAILIPDTTALNNMLSGRTGDLRRVMAGFAGVATRNARELAVQRFSNNYGRRSGNYVRSIRSSFPSADELHIEANVNYAASIELGSTPHGIHGTKPPNFMLVWPPERSNTNDWVRTPSVDHPGNKPYRILTDAVIETSRQLGF